MYKILDDKGNIIEKVATLEEAEERAKVLDAKKVEVEIINEKVDSDLKKLEKIYGDALEGNKVAQEELDNKVKELMKEFDDKEAVKSYVKVKDISDYIALTISMPMSDEVKEKVIEELVKVCEEDGNETN